MITKRIRTVQLLSGAGLLAVAMAANAVEIDPKGSGDVLIVPVWATTLQNASLITISSVEPNSEEAERIAVRLRLRDEDGDVVFSANLYLRTNLDTWTASLVSTPEGGTLLNSADATCALIETDGLVQVLSGSVTIPAQAGYLEAFAMASPQDQALQEMISAMDCAGLAAKWNTGTWATQPGDSMGPPAHRMRGVVQMVDVPKGTSYVIEATALTKFTDIAQHTRPGDASPNLGTAHDSGTLQGATRSRLCLGDDCVEDTWSDPRDAVAAALMVHRLSGDYSREPNLAAKTDVVITYPLRHLGTADQDLFAVAVQLYDRQGGRYESPGSCPMPPMEFCQSTLADHPKTIGVISMNLGFAPHAVNTTSGILGLITDQNFPDQSHGQIPDAGWFRAGFERFFEPALVSDIGRRYYGEPAISVILQEYTNGNLPAPDGVTQRANYGLARMPVRQTWPDDFQ